MSVFYNCQRAMCIKGLFWPPYVAKKMVFKNSSNWFIRTIVKVQKSVINSTFTIAMVTKMATKICLK